MMDLRKTLEWIVMEHCHLNKRLNHVETELNDLISFVHDNEFKKLLFAVTTS